jgi:hypothetical protein
MNNNIESVLSRVRTWSKERQEDVAELLKLIEAHDRSPYRLTDDQAEEVRRRLAKSGQGTLTLDQLDNRLRLLGV